MHRIRPGAWLVVGILLVGGGNVRAGEAPGRVMKAGIIGCDAHALPWTKILNNPDAEGALAEMRVVAAYAGGSPDIPKSIELRDRSVGPIKALGVELVDSIDELLKKVDVVMILSIDGRRHLAEAKKVFASGKPVFIDKPIAGSLADAIQQRGDARPHSRDKLDGQFESFGVHDQKRGRGSFFYSAAKFLRIFATSLWA